MILDRGGSSLEKDILIFSVKGRPNEKKGSPFQEEPMVDPFFTLGKKYMNFEIFFQLIALFFILAAGPLVIVLLASRSGNL